MLVNDLLDLPICIWPIVDDALYGNMAIKDISTIRHKPIALHAWSIEYDDPENKQKIVAQAPVPETPIWSYWRDAISSRIQESQ